MDIMSGNGPVMPDVITACLPERLFADKEISANMIIFIGTFIMFSTSVLRKYNFWKNRANQFLIIAFALYKNRVSETLCELIYRKKPLTHCVTIY